VGSGQASIGLLCRQGCRAGRVQTWNRP